MLLRELLHTLEVSRSKRSLVSPSGEAATTSPALLSPTILLHYTVLYFIKYETQ